MAQSISFDIIARDKASSTFSRISKSSERSHRGLAKFGKLAAVGIGAVGFAAGALAKSSIGLEASFSRTMAQVAAATGAPSSAIKDLNALAMKLGADTSFSANEAAGAMLELGKAGISTSNIMGGALEGTLLLAAAGSTDLATASTIASNAMNTFNLRGSDMGKIAAALAGGANASSASVESLGEALRQVGPGATNAGLSLQQTVGVLSAFDAAGVKGSDAGTSLKTMLARLVPQTDKARGAMKKLGLDFTTADGSFVSITDVADQLQKKLGDLSEEQRTTALTTIFGSDATRAATVLMNEGERGLRKFIEATKDQSAAQKLANANMSGTAGALERLKGSFETAQLAIGQALAPAVQRAANLMSTKVLPAFTRIVPKIAAAFGRIDLSGLGANLAEQAKGWAAPIIEGFKVGLDTGDWSGLGKALGNGLIRAVEGAGSLLGKIGSTLGKLLGKVDWIGIGVEMGKQAPSLLVGLAIGILNFDILGLLKGLGKHWQEALAAVLMVAFAPAKLIGAVGKMLARIPLVGKMLQWALLHFKKFSDGLVGMVGKALGFLGKAFVDGFRRVFPTVGNAFAEALKLLPTRIGVVALDLQAKALSMMRGLAGAITRGIGAVVAKIGELIARILKPWASAGGWLVSKGVALLRGLGRGIASAISPVIGAARSVITKIIGAYASAGSWLVGKGVAIMRGLGSGVKSGAVAVFNFFRGIGGRILNALGNVGSLLLEAGKSVVSGLISGIRAKAGELLSVVGDLAGKVKAAFKGALGIKSPSRVFRGYGQNIIEGLRQGLDGGRMTVKKALDRLTGMFDAVRDKIASLRDTRAGFLSTFSSDSIFGADLETTGKSLSGLLAFQQGQATRAAQLAADVRRVASMGLSKSLISQLQAAGSSGAEQLRLLAGGTAAQIQQFNSLDRQTQASLQAAGMTAGNTVRGGSINADIAAAQRQEQMIERIVKKLRKLDDDKFVVIEWNGEVLVKAVKKRNRDKGVRTAGI